MGNIKIVSGSHIAGSNILPLDLGLRSPNAPHNIGLMGRRMSSMARSFFGLSALIASPVAAQSVGYNPAGSGPIVAAVAWIQGTLLGTVATVTAVIAVAVVGFMMLSGRMNWRYGATVILGCFILFGAASIVAGIQSAASSPY